MWWSLGNRLPSPNTATSEASHPIQPRPLTSLHQRFRASVLVPGASPANSTHEATGWTALKRNPPFREYRLLPSHQHPQRNPAQPSSGSRRHTGASLARTRHRAQNRFDTPRSITWFEVTGLGDAQASRGQPSRVTVPASSPGVSWHAAESSAGPPCRGVNGSKIPSPARPPAHARSGVGTPMAPKHGRAPPIQPAG